MSLEEKNIELFKKQLESSYLEQDYANAENDVDILGLLEFNDISFDLTTLMKQYEPYGQDNPNPKFMTSNVQIADVNTMGKENEHLRFSFQKNGIYLAGVKFKTKEIFENGSNVTIIYTINENHFRGKTTIQLMIDKVLVT